MALCRCCGDAITTGDVCLYVRGRVFHADCYARLLAPSYREQPPAGKLAHQPGDALIASCGLVIGYRKDETLLIDAIPQQGKKGAPIIDLTPDDYRK